jgi:hypothetical protein
VLCAQADPSSQYMVGNNTLQSYTLAFGTNVIVNDAYARARTIGTTFNAP